MKILGIESVRMWSTSETLSGTGLQSDPILVLMADEGVEAFAVGSIDTGCWHKWQM